MRKFIILFNVLSSIALGLDTAPPRDVQLWQNHCAQITEDPTLVLKKLTVASNRLSFTNHGGLFNGGVCWWHSRLTRSAQYLAVFNPSGLAPTADEAYRLVKRLRDGRPVTINGYKNLADFSNAHYRAVQKNLEDWQISNGGFGLGFIDGLSGSTTVPATILKKLMDDAFQEFSTKKKALYQVLQLPGVTAHAWLIINMSPRGNGYQFQVIDSNYLDVQTWSYNEGDTHFSYGGSSFVNYTTKRGRSEEIMLSKRLASACQSIANGQKMTDSALTIDEELDLMEHSPYQP